NPGDRIRILLKNSLQLDANDDCVWAKSNCDCSDPNNLPTCCNAVTDPGSSMNCFHGSNTTNLHLHGLHVSPRMPQDWISLELQPSGATAPKGMSHGAGSVPVVFVQGQFQYDVDPLDDHQSEGTHWYHPHKHGSTSEQVGDGMAGALIVQG